MIKKIVLATTALLCCGSIMFANTDAIKQDKAVLISEDSIPLLTTYFSAENWSDFLKGINENIKTYNYYPVDKTVLFPMKDGKVNGSPEWVDNVQIRLKGNTSRTCPETVFNADGSLYCGHDTTKKHQFNQAHFQLKFKNPKTGEYTALMDMTKYTLNLHEAMLHI